MRLARFACVCLAAVSIAPVAAADTTPGQAIAALNAQREAHGIPGGIVENPAWSVGCDRHIGYLQANGGGLVHDEESGNPGYTIEGDEAGNSSVLSRGDSWTTGNPWETAPIHLHQLLGPRLSVTGVADRDGYVCMTTWPGYQRPAPPNWVTYTYPGPGAAGFRFEETAAESPFTPGEKVGIPEGTTTGPYLYVMFDGPFEHAQATATAASLTGPDGPVDIAVVDNQTEGAGGYLPTGMELIPRRPLRPLATYTAAVSAVVADTPVSHSWTFTTAARPNEVDLNLGSSGERSSEAVVTGYSQAPGPVVTLTGPGGRVLTPTLDREGTATVRLPVAGGWRACLTSGGLPSEFVAAEQCASRTFPAALKLSLPTRIRGNRLRMTVPAVAVGKRAKVTVYALRGRTSVAYTSRSVKLRRTTVVALPDAPRARRWEILLSAGGFTRGTVKYERLNLRRVYRSVR